MKTRSEGADKILILLATNLCNRSYHETSCLLQPKKRNKARKNWHGRHVLSSILACAVVLQYFPLFFFFVDSSQIFPYPWKNAFVCNVSNAYKQTHGVVVNHSSKFLGKKNLIQKIQADIMSNHFDPKQPHVGDTTSS